MIAGERNQIPDWLEPRLSKVEVERIEKAVAEAELGTRGEIVPVIVKTSTRATSGVAATIALVFLVFFLLLSMVNPLAFSHEFLLDFALSLVAAVILGWTLNRSPPVRRYFLPPEEISHQVAQRAELEFYRLRVDRTKNRVGILLFLSLAEHRALVLADETIAAHLPPETWMEIVRLMTCSISQGQLGRGLEEAVAASGRILREHFPAQQMDPNELANRLWMKE